MIHPAVIGSIAGARRRSVAASYDPTADSAVKQWLYAPDLALSDGDLVQTWTAGVGVNYTQPASGQRPTFKTSIQNSLAVVRFDGTDNAMGPASLITALTQPYTLLFVLKLNAIAGAYTTDGGNGAGANRIILNDNGSNKFALYSGASNQLMGTPSAFHTLAIELNGASSRWRQDGSGWTTMTSSPGSSDCDGLTLGSNYGQGGSFSSCDIGEVFIRDGAISSDDEATIVDGYLRDTWATW